MIIVGLDHIWTKLQSQSYPKAHKNNWEVAKVRTLPNIMTLQKKIKHTTYKSSTKHTY